MVTEVVKETSSREPSTGRLVLEYKIPRPVDLSRLVFTLNSKPSRELAVKDIVSVGIAGAGIAGACKGVEPSDAELIIELFLLLRSSELLL